MCQALANQRQSCDYSNRCYLYTKLIWLYGYHRLSITPSRDSNPGTLVAGSKFLPFLCIVCLLSW